MKKLLLILFFFITLSAQAKDPVGKIIGDTKEGLNKSISSLFDKFSNFSKANISPEKFEIMSNDVLKQIKEECCAETFDSKKRLLEIKTSIEDCLSNNCHKKKVLIITKKNKKLIALNEINEAEDLLFKNIKLVYNEDLIEQKKLYDEQLKNNSKLLAKFNKTKEENLEKIKKNNETLEQYKKENNATLEKYKKDLSENLDKLNLTSSENSQLQEQNDNLEKILNLTSAQISQLQEQNDNLEKILKEIRLTNDANSKNYEDRIEQLSSDYEILLNSNENQKTNFKDFKLKMDNRIEILTVENNNVIEINQSLSENLKLMEKNLNLMLEDLPPFDRKKWKEKLNK